MSFFTEDVVSVTVNGIPENAVVINCFAFEEETANEAARLGMIHEPLLEGTLEVLFSNGTTGIVKESDCRIVDRGFQVGDFVQTSDPNSKSNSQAGIIISLSTQVKLTRVLSGEVIGNDSTSTWFDSKLLVSEKRLNRGDHVIFNNWIGMVEATFEMAQVEVANGLRRICDLGPTLSVGASADMLLFDREMQVTTSGSEIRKIREVRQIAIAINWLAMSQFVESNSNNSNSTSRPPRYFSDLEINTLTSVKSTSDYFHSIGDKVVFRDPTLHPPSIELLEQPSSFGHNVLVVTATKSIAEVLWQNGERQFDLPAPSLEHHINNLDENIEIFPGDIGIFTPNKKIGIVQSINNKTRTIVLRFLGTNESEVISSLEFENGSELEAYGIRRGFRVLISDSNQTNGTPIPVVPRLGESETLNGSFPCPEQLRDELSALGLSKISNLNPIPSLSYPKSGSESSNIKWYGEVIDLNLDGTVKIKFPSGEIESLPLNRLYFLDDGLYPNDDDEMGESNYIGDEDEDEEYKLKSDNRMSVGSDESWENEDEDEISENGMPGSASWLVDDEMNGSKNIGWADEKEEEVIEVVNPLSKVEIEEKESIEMKVEEISSAKDLPEYENWKRFIMLEEPPIDHHYLKEPIQIPPKTFISRIKKEYDVLSTSLPSNILVRAYENRTDLLRVLIIGPIGTPFESAPFLFDFFLPPNEFPISPPKVYFHSWNSNSRISPNLYLDGKVCLSLLNTWPGDKIETWNSKKSSILQILISIQSLIMVELPYFTEPGFESQFNTPEGKLASGFYNERTFVLSRNFIKRGLEFLPLNFEEEIKAFYLTGLSDDLPGVLVGVIEQMKALIEESEGSIDINRITEGVGEGEAEDKLVTIKESSILPNQKVLTEGACLTLKRTLSSLIQFSSGSSSQNK